MSSKLVEGLAGGEVNCGSNATFSVDTIVIATREVDERCSGSSILHCFVSKGARNSEG